MEDGECYIRGMNDFNDSNSQIPYDAGSTGVSQPSQGAQFPSSQQYAQYQPYGQQAEQPYDRTSQSQHAQQIPQPQYGQGAQYGPAQPQYGQASQYGSTSQYGSPQPQYGQSQYGQPRQGSFQQPQYQPGYGQPTYQQMPGYQPQQPAYYGPQPKSKLAAGLLGIFLGSLGVHNFYLGYTGKAVAQLLLTVVGWILLGLGPVAAWIWGLIEGILILCSTYGSNWHRDAKGIELSE